jgi:hypothetical protein
MMHAQSYCCCPRSIPSWDELCYPPLFSESAQQKKAKQERPPLEANPEMPLIPIPPRPHSGSISPAAYASFLGVSGGAFVGSLVPNMAPPMAQVMTTAGAYTASMVGGGLLGGCLVVGCLCVCYQCKKGCYDPS